ncbi:MAG: type II secretion system F family protein [Planctomycetota bacterium]|nr:type II secretion system F family protein [Planctomycetota bacterium]
MSVVEYNLLTDGPPSTRRLANDDSFADTKSKAYKGDVFRRTSTRDICLLTRQLATLLRAGMPLVPALSALVEQVQGSALSQVIEDVHDSVNAGSSFAGALGRHPSVFSNLFVNMVAAGETSGTLEEVLLRLAEMLDKRAHLTSKVKSVIAYPLMLSVVAVGVVMFLLSFVVPSITQIFLEINRQLPWPTRLLISTSAFIKTYLLVIIAAVCAAVFGIGAWVRTEEGRAIWDRSKLKLPLFGKLFLKLEIARLARTLGILLASGIPVLSALEITKGVVQNRFVAGALGSVKDLVSKGDNVAAAIRKTGLFPPIVFHIIATGQISGDIEGGLLSIADMYDGEVELTAKTLTSLLEPAIVLAMGAIVGFIVLAILLPIFEINQVL